MDLKETLETGEQICSMHSEQAGVARKVLKIYGGYIDFKGAQTELLKARDDLKAARLRVTERTTKLRDMNTLAKRPGRGGCTDPTKSTRNSLSPDVDFPIMDTKDWVSSGAFGRAHGATV